jgi:glycosyltransferase involved in cell wall biosynthesis
LSAPRVAVVVTCFDLGEFLPETLASLRSQTVPDWELVVVDDGSTDFATLELLDRLRDDGVRVLRTANRGLSAARNLGIASTSAPVLCMVDADDLLAPELFEKSLAVLDARPEVAFVSHWLEAFGAEQWEWRPASCDLAAMVLANQVNGAALVRRAAVEAVGGFDESMRDGCEDWDLWLTLLERGCHGEILPEILFRYRRRPDAMTAEMLRGDRFARTCKFLAEKHAATYARFAKEAIAARDVETHHLLGHLEDLETSDVLWMQPELEKRRDDVAELERRAAAAAEARRRDEVRLHLEREAEAARERGDQLERRVHELVNELSARVAELGGATTHAAELERMLREVGDRSGHLEAAAKHWQEAFASARDEALRWHAESNRLAGEESRWQEAFASARDEALRWHAESNRLADEESRWREAFASACDEALRWHAESGRLAHELEAILASWSWRLTAPLRAVARRARREP